MPKFTESQKKFIYQAKLYEFKKMNRKLQNLKGYASTPQNGKHTQSLKY